ncbi:MAG: hypothetical protein M1838_002024 [Thelocarpon superellum]|nr:MAG: hypothetical protein M1838_002024 [Thelocarpon superellum]
MVEKRRFEHEADSQNGRGSKLRKPLAPGPTAKPSLALGQLNTPGEHQVLPDLPPLHDAELSAAVYTHAGSVPYGGTAVLDQSYERLEFLGDAYLECMASRIAFYQFPKLAAGRLAQIRESLVNNWTLAEYALAYGFDEKIRAPESIMQNSSGRKVLADVFEAYVAALLLQAPATGFVVVEDWLTQLWAPKLLQHQRIPEVNMEAKQDLAKLVLSKDVKLHYVDQRQPEVSKADKGKTNFFVDVLLTGWGRQRQKLGSGVGWSKNQAGCRAAMDAMANRALIDELTAIKRAYDARVAAQRAKERQADVEPIASTSSRIRSSSP